MLPLAPPASPPVTPEVFVVVVAPRACRHRDLRLHHGLHRAQAARDPFRTIGPWSTPFWKRVGFVWVTRQRTWSQTGLLLGDADTFTPPLPVGIQG